MNEQQRLSLVQSRSDWDVYRRLGSAADCHQLHYSQMCTEKLAKAFFWKHPSAAGMNHTAFVKFVRAIGTNQKVAAELGYGKPAAFREWIKDVSDLAYELQRLAPALAFNGPNAEYPWPRDQPLYVPVEFTFPVMERLKTANGRNLVRMIDVILERFDQWF